MFHAHRAATRKPVPYAGAEQFSQSPAAIEQATLPALTADFRAEMDAFILTLGMLTGDSDLLLE